VQQICDRVGVINNGRMVVESTVEELRGDSELVIRATPADVVRATLDRLAYVQAIRTLDDELRLRVDERHTGEVTRALVLAGTDVHEVRRVDRQLEDVFFEITAKESSHADVP
jgi:ABC-2 type transport system ATP-binding protein